MAAHLPVPEKAPSVASRVSFAHILQRVGMPLLIFTSVFTGALGVSRVVILPALTAVEIDGHTQDISALETEATTLRDTLASLEQKRDREIIPLDGTAYRTLADAKVTAHYPLDLLHSVRDIAAAVVPEHPGSIVISEIAYQPLEHALSLTGDVRGVGPSSMTVLAQFLEILRSDERIDSVTPPAFTRLEDPTIGQHSPFTLSLKLR
jgi:hypothetical protein